MKTEAYARGIEGMLLRFLSYVDRNPFSPTFGCMDRQWWHYKAAASFPAATYQQGVLVLSWLLQNSSGQDAKNWTRLLEAGVLFWTRVQHRDGSFDEWYPSEHSFVATAFTSYAVSEVLLNTGDRLNTHTRTDALKALERSGHWLSRRDDLVVSNHQAGKIAALGNLAQLFPQGSFAHAAGEGLQKLLACQDEEGWFPEYGGADPAYQSVTCDYLAKYWARSGDDRALKSLERGIEFLNYFLHPDGTFGGIYGSRNASYLLTHGLELVRDRIPAADALLVKAHESAHKNIPWIPRGADDRYLIFFFLPNLVQSHEAFGKRTGHQDVRPRFQTENDRWFSRAGLLVQRCEDRYLVCNIKKGGVFLVYGSGREHPGENDGGYFMQLADRSIAASQGLLMSPGEALDRRLKQGQGQNFEIWTESPFMRVNRFLSSPGAQMLFLFWTQTLGRIAFFRDRLDRFLKRTLIQRVRRERFHFVRYIRVTPEGLHVRDVIRRLPGAQSVRALGRVCEATAIYVPSSRLCGRPRPAAHIEPADDADALAQELNEKGEVTLERHVPLK